MRTLSVVLMMLGALASGCATSRDARRASVDECSSGPTTLRVFFAEDASGWGTNGAQAWVVEGVSEAIELSRVGDDTAAAEAFESLAEKTKGSFRVACLSAAATCALRSGDLARMVELARVIDVEAVGADRAAPLISDVLALAKFAASQSKPAR